MRLWGKVYEMLLAREEIKSPSKPGQKAYNWETMMAAYRLGFEEGIDAVHAETKERITPWGGG